MTDPRPTEPRPAERAGPTQRANPSEHPSPTERRIPTEHPVDRARVYTVVGVIMAIGTIYFLFGNVLLVPVCGLSAMFCAWRGWKNGASRPLMLGIFAVGALPALFAGIALISLLWHLPTLKLSGVTYQRS